MTQDSGGVQRKGFGHILVDAGLLTTEQVDEALAVQKSLGERLASVLVRQSLLTEKFSVTYLGRQLGVPGVDFSTTEVDLQVLRLVPLDVCEKHVVFPIRIENGHLLLAMHDPLDRALTHQLERDHGVRVTPCVALEVSLKYAISEARRAVSEGRSKIHSHVQQHLEPIDDAQPAEGGDGAARAKRAKPGRRQRDPASGTQAGPDGAASGDAAQAQPASPTGRVLIATTDDANRSLLTQALSGAGHTVVTTGSGADAVHRAPSADLVILDADPPGVHAFEACRRIKRLKPHLPVMILSAHGGSWRMAGDAREALGADAHIDKPVPPGALLSQVDRLLGAVRPVPASKQSAARNLKRGMAAIKNEDLAAATAALLRAAEEDPLDELAPFYLGMANEKLGKPFEAIDHYERAVAINGEFHDALARLGEIYENVGFRRKAADAWERLAFVTPAGRAREAIKQRLVALLG